MRLLRRFVAALFLLLFLPAAGLRPAAAGITWGVNGHPMTAYPGVSIVEQLDLLKDVGARSYRVDIRDLAAADTLATLVVEGRARGITILPVLTPALDLAALDESRLYDEARRVAQALGTRFRNDIRVWELGNELENFAIIQPCEKRDDGTTYPCEWGPAGGTTALDYYGPRWSKVSAVLRGLSDGMAEADPTILTAMGTAGWGHTGAFERLKADGIAWDISVWHMYGEDPEWAFRQLAAYGKPIWVTEFNHPGGSQEGEQAQADGLVKAMALLHGLQARYPVEQAHIYELIDETYWAPSFEAVMGIVGLEGNKEAGWRLGRPKPAFEAVRRFIRDPHPLPPDDCAAIALDAIADPAFRTVRRGYCLVLGRSVSENEAEGWLRAIRDGSLDEADLLAGMLASEESRQTNGLAGMSDRTYVEFLYQRLLGRAADGGGLDGYLRQLQDGTATRETIAQAIARSSEFSARHGSR